MFWLLFPALPVGKYSDEVHADDKDEQPLLHEHVKQT
jgi:hypothetical protein